MAKKLTQGQKIKKADKLCAQYVKLRDHNTCQACGKYVEKGINWAHGFPRSYQRVRWDPRNSWCLCSGCHLRYTYRPIEWDTWMIDKMGSEEYMDVRMEAVDYHSPKIDLDMVLQDLADLIAKES